MSYWPDRSILFITFYTVASGIVGAALAYYLSLPIYPLLGPALFVSVISLTKIKFAIAHPVRDAALLFIGISIGAGVNTEAAITVIRWPLAFVALALMLIVALLICQWVLFRIFDFDRRSALLAATPGHFSFIMSLGSMLDVDITRIAVVQTIRVLALTLCVPFVAMAFGIDVSSNILPAGPTMASEHVLALMLVSIIVGIFLQKLNVPAAFLIAAMSVSLVGQLLQLTPGKLSPIVGLPCFVIVGTMIGSRFSGITVDQLKISFLAGVVATVVNVILVLFVAIPVAIFIAMPAAHVVVAFSPGGLETMIAMGAVIGANPGFVAACHVGRLFLLAILVPLILSRQQKHTANHDPLN